MESKSNVYALINDSVIHAYGLLEANTLTPKFHPRLVSFLNYIDLAVGHQFLITSARKSDHLHTFAENFELLKLASNISKKDSLFEHQFATYELEVHNVVDRPVEYLDSKLEKMEEVGLKRLEAARENRDLGQLEVEEISSKSKRQTASLLDSMIQSRPKKNNNRSQRNDSQNETLHPNLASNGDIAVKPYKEKVNERYSHFLESLRLLYITVDSVSEEVSLDDCLTLAEISLRIFQHFGVEREIETDIVNRILLLVNARIDRMTEENGRCYDDITEKFFVFFKEKYREYVKVRRDQGDLDQGVEALKKERDAWIASKNGEYMKENISDSENGVNRDTDDTVGEVCSDLLNGHKEDDQNFDELKVKLYLKANLNDQPDNQSEIQTNQGNLTPPAEVKLFTSYFQSFLTNEIELNNLTKKFTSSSAFINFKSTIEQNSLPEKLFLLFDQIQNPLPLQATRLVDCLSTRNRQGLISSQESFRIINLFLRSRLSVFDKDCLEILFAQTNFKELANEEISKLLLVLEDLNESDVAEGENRVELEGYRLYDSTKDFRHINLMDGLNTKDKTILMMHFLKNHIKLNLATEEISQIGDNAKSDLKKIENTKKISFLHELDSCLSLFEESSKENIEICTFRFLKFRLILKFQKRLLNQIMMQTNQSLSDFEHIDAILYSKFLNKEKMLIYFSNIFILVLGNCESTVLKENKYTTEFKEIVVYKLNKKKMSAEKRNSSLEAQNQMLLMNLYIYVCLCQNKIEFEKITHFENFMCLVPQKLILKEFVNEQFDFLKEILLIANKKGFYKSFTQMIEMDLYKDS